MDNKNIDNQKNNKIEESMSALNLSVCDIRHSVFSMIKDVVSQLVDEIFSLKKENAELIEEIKRLEAG